MTLESQVCSLELAKKLEELGVKQDGCFIYGETQEDGWIIYPGEHMEGVYDWVNAYTVAELGEMLPWSITIEGKSYHLEIMPSQGSTISGKQKIDMWHIAYARMDTKHIAWSEANTEADARAKMLIYLLENKLITL